jgi:oxygen-independent coproporphyrinogen III oxidase
VPGIYISYPFCQQKCTFCNFASDVPIPEVRERYHSALLAEMRSHKWDWAPETLYFGGGTPSLMPQDLLRFIMETIPQERLGEITIECAPGTLNRKNVRFWSAQGVNRASLGVQSFVDEELRLTGRRHRVETVVQDVMLLRSEGIENINIDLIAGLPGQSSESWEASLDWIERLAPPHVSVYIFETDEDSRLGQEVLLGGVRYGANRMPSEDLMAELYEQAVSRLKALSLERYEISNFARPGFSSRHNLKYWQLAPYAGFGLDAHSFDGKARWSNPDSLPLYFQRLGDAAELIPTDAGEEHFFVGLRLMRGIEPSANEWIRFAAPIDKWSKVGMLERDGSRLRLSPKGVLLSNEIFEEFVGVC